MNLNLKPASTIWITGASQGIGEAFALEWARAGHDVILTARSEDRLNQIADQIRALGQQAHVIPADLSNRESVKALIQSITDLNLQVDVLVNNAGYGIMRSFADTDSEDVAGMIEVNTQTLAALTHFVLPGMLNRQAGGILNVASIAGFAPGPYMAVYFATKSFVLSLSEALHHECRKQGVVVTALCPGAVRTGFGHRSGISEDQFQSAPGMMSAEETAQAGIRAFMSGKRVIVPGLFNKLSVWMLQVLPHPATLKMMGWVQTRIQARRSSS